MSGNPTQGEAVFVLHLSLDYAVAKIHVVLCGWDAGSPGGWWPEAGAFHLQGSEYLASAEVLQGLSGDHFESAAEQNEAGIGVLRMRARSGGEWQPQTSVQ